MEILTRELLENKIKKGEIGTGFRVLLKKGSQEIIVDPRGKSDHQTMATNAGIGNEGIAYAGTITDIGIKTLWLDRAGDSLVREGGYKPDVDGEAATAAILLGLLKQIDEQFDLEISGL